MGIVTYTKNMTIANGWVRDTDGQSQPFGTISGFIESGTVVLTETGRNVQWCGLFIGRFVNTDSTISQYVSRNMMFGCLTKDIAASFPPPKRPKKRGGVEAGGGELIYSLAAEADRLSGFRIKTFVVHLEIASDGEGLTIVPEWEAPLSDSTFYDLMGGLAGEGLVRAGDETPSQAGDETPDRAGEETPNQAGDETPDQAGDETPDRAGEETPSQAGDETPNQALRRPSGRRQKA
jgi:hypothetical protein